ncbi:hypothetical protein EYV94_11395 [Puteibacter caeruleilacunae]|nr:hypothetical protein EYV94_11395 [Puteibacter caeruleilacunae]
MKKSTGILALIMTLVVAVSVNVFAHEDCSKLIGKWKYEVSEAPYEYSKGEIVFEKKEGKLVGKVILPYGDTMKLENIKVSGETVSFGVTIDYEYVGIKTKIAANKMTGKVNSPEGAMELKAEKKKK